jgi:hypothetical protein
VRPSAHRPTLITRTAGVDAWSPRIAHRSLDQVPIPILFVAFDVLALLVYELGFRLGRQRQERTPEVAEEGHTGVFVGSLLALMAFLLAATLGMASDRFDTEVGSCSRKRTRSRRRTYPGRVPAPGAGSSLEGAAP